MARCDRVFYFAGTLAPASAVSALAIVLATASVTVSPRALNVEGTSLSGFFHHDGKKPPAHRDELIAARRWPDDLYPRSRGNVAAGREISRLAD
jgi:hypothetical protein